jgi:hypothetical protein
MLYILPGTKIYRDLIKNKEFDEKLWAKTDSVYYYTKEHNISTLNRWRKAINNSGIRLPFDYKYIWDYAGVEKKEEAGALKRGLRKNLKKITRSINMLRNRY